MNDAMQLTSPAFKNGDVIPEQYTCRGQNVNPQFNILNLPSETKSLALIMHDPDAPVGDFVHWTMWDIPPNTSSIGTNSVPVGAIQGVTGFNNNKYGGPCPPAGSGTHRYIFELYALDTMLNLEANTELDKLQEAIKGRIVADATLTGLVAAKS